MATNDCGLYVNGVGQGTRFDGTYNVGGASYPNLGSCDPYTNWENWNATMVEGYKNIALATMDALQVGNRILICPFLCLQKLSNGSSGHGR